ncbi:TPR repeat-containing protein [Roseibium sp. TrichSKD4]|uniref:hypothetical protein n=1 Tax=Roseibium sp. TrichSKD4 TaxID=744980 RepID=UPI0001E562EB|nr:hypothetical protein [Roseibium sp. TrichSKD4]EFO34525.1 TPR repeat-containing protein [Roseibium sp. TrichSKD4]
MTKAGHVIQLPQKRAGSELKPLPDAEAPKQLADDVLPQGSTTSESEASSPSSGKWDPSKGERRNLSTRPWATIPSERRRASDNVEGTEPDAPTDDQVRTALKNILTSAEFSSVPQLRAFLNYVVCAVLDRRVDEIKGYTIAVEALGRDPSFNPVTDPIVRVEAARLRRRLSDFYEGSGNTAPLRITIPKGSYVPDISLHMIPNQMEQSQVPHSAAQAAPEAPTASMIGDDCAKPAISAGQIASSTTAEKPAVEAFLQRHIVSIACLASFLLGFVIGRL